MVFSDSSSVQRLLVEAQSMRRDMGSLVGRLAAEGTKREAQLAAIPQKLDQLVRSGQNPAALGAFLQRIQNLKGEGEARNASIGTAVTDFGKLYDRLSAMHDILEPGSIEHTLISGEMSLCTGVMAALGAQWHRNTLELGVVAALADGPKRLALPEAVEKRSAGGIIIPAGASAG